MKKYLIPGVLSLMFLVVLSSCFHGHYDDDMSITIMDNDNEYEMDASFHRNKNHAVQVYLNEHLLNNRGSLKTTGEITLEDNTTFYINAHSGRLRIKVDKAENSEESCERMRRVCEHLKEIIVNN